MAIDLRDGVRLARTAEILTAAPRKSILSSLRLPAVSRLQKLHNVGVALKVLRDFGVPIGSDIFPYHVVDAHREIVLKVFWSIVAHCCLKNLVNAEQLEAEIQRLGRLGKRRAHNNSHCARIDEDLSEIFGGDDLHQLLFRWCRAVCSTFGVHVGNLTTDMADGEAVCLLIHYYHPNLLRRSEVRKTTRDLRVAGNINTANEDTLQRLRANERANAALANTRMSELGGIPKMVPVMDTSSLPDEKSILLCLSFMCSRLLESKLEIRSCVLIQKRYRRYREIVERERKLAAASVILKTWRERRIAYYQAQRNKYGKAVQVVERFTLACKAGLERRRDQRLIREAVRTRASVRIQVTLHWQIHYRAIEVPFLLVDNT